MHNIECRFVTRPSNIPFACVYVGTFQPGNVTGWGSEGVSAASETTIPTEDCSSNLVFYAQSTIAVITGRNGRLRQGSEKKRRRQLKRTSPAILLQICLEQLAGTGVFTTSPYALPKSLRSQLEGFLLCVVLSKCSPLLKLPYLLENLL